MLFIYKLIWSILYSRVLTVPCFHAKFPSFNSNIFPPCYSPTPLPFLLFTLHHPYKILRRLPYPLSRCSPCVLYNQERDGYARLGKKRNSFVRVCAKNNSHSRSLCCRVLGRRSPRIIHEYNLMTAI